MSIAGKCQSSLACSKDSLGCYVDTGLEGLRVEAWRPGRTLFQTAGKSDADAVSGREAAVSRDTSGEGHNSVNSIKLQKDTREIEPLGLSAARMCENKEGGEELEGSRF